MRSTAVEAAVSPAKNCSLLDFLIFPSYFILPSRERTSPTRSELSMANTQHSTLSYQLSVIRLTLR